MRASLKVSWDDAYLYFRVSQTARSTETIEAPSVEALTRHWWDFEDVILNFDPGRGLTSTAATPEITLGWSSIGRTNLVLSPDLTSDELHVTTSGRAAEADRTIEGRVSWAGLNRVYGFTDAADKWPAVGRKLGCQPLLVDGTFSRQAYIGGARYVKPSGYDRNSRTLVLAGS
jgi:hypothetical protein